MDIRLAFPNEVNGDYAGDEDAKSMLSQVW